MSLSGTKERERTKDQVPGDPVGGDDHPVSPCRLLDQDLGMFRTGQTGHEFSIGHRSIDGRVPPEIPEPPAREDRRSFREPETPCNLATLFDEPDLLSNRPALVDPDRGEEEEVPIGGLQESDPLQMVDTHGQFECPQGRGCRQTAPNGGIDPTIDESRNKSRLGFFGIDNPGSGPE